METVTETEYPIDAESGRKICTSAKPAPENLKGRWMHPEALDDGDTPYFDYYKCPACGLRFSVEVAE